MATKIKSTGIADLTTDISLVDNAKILVGTGDDLQIYHDSNNSYIDTAGGSTGDLYIRAQGTSHDLILRAADNIYIQPQGNDNGITVTGDGPVILYHNSSEKLTTTTTGVDVTGQMQADSAYITGALTFPDGQKIKMGASEDLQIWHSGSKSYIKDAGTGNMAILTNTLELNNAADSQNMIVANEGGAVTLYHSGSAKLATSSSGVTVTGTIAGATATASGGTNTTALASTAFVQQEITTLIGGAPSTLNDLNELAAAINDDANYNSTLTTALATKLPLAGGTMTGDITMASTAQINASSAFYLDSDIIHFRANNETERMRIQSSGIGINETAPFGKLHISDTQTGRTSADSVANLLVLEDDENGMSILSANAGAGYILFGDVADSAAGGICYDHSANAMRFRVNAAWDVMKIMSDGKVGIGTASPSEKLHVNGAAKIDGNLYLATSSNTPYIVGGTVSTVFRNNANNASNVTILNSGYVHMAGAADVRLTLGSQGTAGNNDANWIRGNGTSLSYNAASANHIWETGGSEKMKLDSSGNLNVYNGAAIKVYRGGNSASAQMFMDSGEKLYIRNSYSNLDIVFTREGNLGLGTTSPNTKLHVLENTASVYGAARFQYNGDNNYEVIRLESLGNYDCQIGFFADGDTNYYGGFGIDYSDAGKFKLQTDNLFAGGTNLMTWARDGKVGIGTTSPTVSLDVYSSAGWGVIDIDGVSGGELRFQKAGTTYLDIYANHTGSVSSVIKATDHLSIHVNNSTADDRTVYLQNSGKVGIGTTSPTSKLHVSGQGSFEQAGNTNRGNVILGAHGSGTAKWATLGATHYNDATGSGSGTGAAGCMMIGNYSDASATTIYIGGGPYELNPATHIKFNTHSSNLHNLGGTTRMIIDSSGKVGIGTTSPDTQLHIQNPSTSWGQYATIRLGSDAEGTNYADLKYYRGADAATEGFKLNIKGTDVLTALHTGNVGIGDTSPFSKLQIGGNTFSGGHGMHNDGRVGISNHGSLTGLMLASTYNDSAHPEYGLVFVQGPSTSSYNVWSISPDGPAKGDSLNFHYQAQSTNIHSPSNAKVVFDGNGNIAFGGNLHFKTAQNGSFIGSLNTSDLRLAADGNHIFQTYLGGWGTRMEIRDNGIRFPAGDYGVHTTQEHYTNPSSPGSYSTATNTAYTSSTQYWPDQGEKLICVINARAYTKYIHIKTNLTANNIMFYFRTKGYFYSYGLEEQLVGGYTYSSGGNVVISKDNKTVAGNTHSGDTYRTSDGSLVLKMDINHTGYTEGKMLVFFHAHAPSTVSGLTVVAVTQKDDGTDAF